VLPSAIILTKRLLRQHMDEVSLFSIRSMEIFSGGYIIKGAGRSSWATAKNTAAFLVNRSGAGQRRAPGSQARFTMPGRCRTPPASGAPFPADEPLIHRTAFAHPSGSICDMSPWPVLSPAFAPPHTMGAAHHTPKREQISGDPLNYARRRATLCGIVPRSACLPGRFIGNTGQAAVQITVVVAPPAGCDG
jgi:hypothetical protein